MKKIIEIKGMTCDHCRARVEMALNSIEGVTAKVDIKKGRATVNVENKTDDAILKNAIIEAGYEVISISEKKGLFG